METLIRLSCAIYIRLLPLYPTELRHRFGGDMAEVFEDLLRDAGVQRGLAGMTSVWSAALWELLSVATPLRLQSHAVIAGALSFVAASILFLAFFRAVS